MSRPRRQSRQPANDEAHALQRMSFVALPRPRWGRYRIAGIGAGIVFLMIAACCAIWAALPQKTEVMPLIADVPLQPVASVVAPQAQVKQDAQPYDISLDASALIPPEEAAQVAGQLPVNVVMGGNQTQRALPPVMDVDIGERRAMPVPPVGNSIETHAADQAKLARRFMKQGDLQQAIMYQTRAAEDAPHNMMLRLELAIMYDRAADRQNAAENYARVLQAYDRHDESLPLSFNAASVGRRLAYLQNQPNDLR